MEEERLLTDEEQANTDKLEDYFKKNIEVHIILKRILFNGKHGWLNGKVTERASSTLWIINERKFGEGTRVSITEIAPQGVQQILPMNTLPPEFKGEGISKEEMRL